MTTPRPAGSSGMAAFLAMWLGLTVSSLGNFLSGFALGVWLYQLTGSVTYQALVVFSSTAPALLASPFAGVLVDRWDRRRAMMLSAAGTGLCSLVLALLFFTGRLSPWTLYPILAVSAAFQALRWPAMSAATTRLVPKRQFGRANGLIQFGMTAAQVLAPLASAGLLASAGVGWVLLADLGAALFALAVLALLAIPPGAGEKAGERRREPFGKELAVGWRYIAERPGLAGLLALFATTNFAIGLVMVLFTPLLLSFAGVEVLGTVQSVASAGLVVGGLAMTLWGGPRRRVVGILWFLAFQGLVLLVAAPRVDAAWIGVAGFAFLFTFPLIAGSSQAIWQAKVAPEVQGRVFAMRRLIALASLPVASLVAGPLSEQVFEPLMAAEGPLAPALGPLLGVGRGSGIRLLLLAMGLLLIATAAVASTRRSLRRVEEELPDLVDEAAAEPPRAGAGQVA